MNEINTSYQPSGEKIEQIETKDTDAHTDQLIGSHHHHGIKMTN